MIKIYFALNDYFSAVFKFKNKLNFKFIILFKNYFNMPIKKAK